MPKIDWIKIKNEYINTNTSYRKLADKYGVSVTAIANKAKSENWVNAKDEQRNKTCTEVVQKTADKIVESEVNRLEKILGLGDKLSEKIDKAIGQLETVIIDGEMVDTGMVDVRGLRSLVRSVKDLKEIASSDGGAKGSEDKQTELIEAIKKAVKENEA